MKPFNVVSKLFVKSHRKSSPKNTAICVKCLAETNPDVWSINHLNVNDANQSTESVGYLSVSREGKRRTLLNCDKSADCISTSNYSTKTYLTTCSTSAGATHECYQDNDKEYHQCCSSDRCEMNKVENESESSRKFNKSQKQCLVCILSVCFASFATMSLIAPFYPDKASKLGLSNQQSGLTFSAYAIASVIFSPIVGRVVPIFGAKNVLLSGIFFNGLANVLFGLTEFIEDKNQFFYACLLLRIVEAFGTISHVCSCYTFVIKMFPDDISYVFSLTESACGAGLASGPALGGLIYSVSGYGVPFYIFGTFVLTCLPVSWYFIDDIKDDDSIGGKESIKDDSSEFTANRKEISFLRLLFKYEVIVNSLVLVLVSSANAFFFPTLEEHLKALNVVNLEIVALEFFIGSTVYVIATIVIGRLLGEIKYQFSVMLLGVCFTILSLVIIGPSVVFSGLIEPGLVNTSIGMVLIGLGTGAAFIPTFECYYKCCIKFGLEDNITTYGAVASLWSMMFSIGEAIGPLCGGWLLDYFNFQDSSSIMACSLVVLLPFLVAMVLKEIHGVNKAKSDQMSSFQESLTDNCTEK